MLTSFPKEIVTTASALLFFVERQDIFSKNSKKNDGHTPVIIALLLTSFSKEITKAKSSLFFEGRYDLASKKKQKKK